MRLRDLLVKGTIRGLSLMKDRVRAFFSKVNSRHREFKRLWKYRGNAVQCPICGGTFSDFMPTEALERSFWKSAQGQRLLNLDYINVANAKCPGCGSGERHRLLYFYLLEQVKLPKQKGIRLLDVAPDKFLCKNLFNKLDIEYISIDISRARKPTYVMDITDLKFPDNSFDAIVCCHVLEHIPEDIKSMKELYRVLKPEGWGILQVPIWAETTIEDPAALREEYEARYGHKGHVRRYGLDYIDKLRSVGFEVTLDQYARNLPNEKVRRYGIFETEDIYFVRKPASIS